jgi:hypothetical protein
MRSFDDIKTFSPRRREKALIMEDMSAARSGKSVMSESEVEQAAGAGQQAAAAQAAQMQTGVAREMMGQPQYAGQAAKFNAEIAGQASDAAAASRANANMLNAQLTTQRNMAARAALAMRSSRRNDNIWKGINAGIATAQTAAPDGFTMGTKAV